MGTDYTTPQFHESLVRQKMETKEIVISRRAHLIKTHKHIQQSCFYDAFLAGSGISSTFIGFLGV